MLKLYYTNINLLRPELLDRYLENLNIQRREKVLRCKKDADKMRSVLAGTLLRYALEQEGLCYQTLKFSQNSYGKPILEGCGDVYFSISHSGDYVICGIADSTIGVDIEDAKRATLQEKSPRLNATAKKFCSSTEYAYYRDSVDWKQSFLKIWTRKESYSKAIGKGLQMDFAQFEVLKDINEGYFWSNWLLDDYYVSVYLGKDVREEPVLVEWKPYT